MNGSSTKALVVSSSSSFTEGVVGGGGLSFIMIELHFVRIFLLC